jgi:hypothetical protein
VTRLSQGRREGERDEADGPWSKTALYRGLLDREAGRERCGLSGEPFSAHARQRTAVRHQRLSVSVVAWRTPVLLVWGPQNKILCLHFQKYILVQKSSTKCN